MTSANGSRRLAGRVAVVTGAGSGMGRCVARRLAEEGAHVVVADLDGEAAHETAGVIEDDGGSAAAREVNAAERASLKTLFEDVGREHGALHVLHNHVGVPAPNALDVDEETWQRVVDINMKSAYYGCVEAFGLLEKADGKGSVILTSSAVALIASSMSPLYSMTKGAVVAFGRSLAVMGAPKGVRANVICPGPVDTPMLPQFFGRPASASIEDLRPIYEDLIPLGRPAQPEEIAGAVAFFASDDSSYITGTALAIDGGWTVK